MVRKFTKLVSLLWLLNLLSAPCPAQTSDNGANRPAQPVSPIGPEKTVNGSIQGGNDSDNNQITVPDSRPLAGAQDLTLGTAEGVHSFVLPSFSIMSQAGSDPYGTGIGGTPEVLSTTYLAGRLGLNKVSLRSQFLFDYLAGGTFSNDPTLGSSLAQGLDVSETLTTGRWTTLIADRFFYASDSFFGFGGIGGADKLGVSLSSVGSSPGLSPGFTPSGSIYVVGLPRADNGAVGQLSYALTRRAKFTVLASDQLENFRHAALQNSNQISIQAGYDYFLTRLNTVAVFYRFDDFTFAGVPQAVHNHTVQASFARRITGRFTWQVGGGPSVQQYQNPVSGAGTVVAPTVFTGLKYRLRSTGFGATYLHGLASGSGLFPGAEADVFSGQVQHAFGKSWTLLLDAGYARNTPISQTFAASSGVALNTWFANTILRRNFVGYGSLFVSFNASGQSTLAPICTIPGCRVSATANTGTIGYTWGLRPIFLD